jgi:hypothetical protein
MGTLVAFRRFVEIRERHRARAAARVVAERPAPEAGPPALEGELVPPPTGRAARLPLKRRGPAKAGPRGTAAD